ANTNAFAGFVIDNRGQFGDIFTASSSGISRVTLSNNGNFGIGDVTPPAALTVGSGDLFQVSSGGDITMNSSTPFINFIDGDTLGLSAGGQTLFSFADNSSSL